MGVGDGLGTIVEAGLGEDVDYGGRTRGSADYFAAADRQVLTAELPTNGARTIYSRIGDVFAWICLACLLALTVASRSRRRVPRLEEARAPETGRE